VAVAFLNYLTIFKARLGLANLVLGTTDLSHQPTAAVLRRIRRTLDAKITISTDDPRWIGVIDYLREKGFAGGRTEGGRYAGLNLRGSATSWIPEDRSGRELKEIELFQTDLWLSDASVPSTIGLPTSNNAKEIHEFAEQLHLVSRRTNSWTAAGQLATALRNVDTADPSSMGNPFALGLEVACLFRQLLRVDRVMMTALVRYLGQGQANVSRDDVVAGISEIMTFAIEIGQTHAGGRGSVRELLEFQKLVAGKRRLVKETPGTRGPGVLEHRISPRLEWLTDLGYLNKDDLPRNSFQYRRSPSLLGLSADLMDQEGTDEASDALAITSWRRNPYWGPIREKHSTREPHEAVLAGYRAMERRIGPAPLREVAFASALFCNTSLSLQQMTEFITEFARETQGVSLSGGRYGRTPENVYISPSALASLDPK
jgi:hypothetical protein